MIQYPGSVLIPAASIIALLPASPVRAQPCEPGWSAQFATPQVGGTVNAQVVFDPDGAAPIPPALYLAGSFDTAGGTLVNNIARWDGATFAPLGSGLTGGFYPPRVVSLAVFDDDGAGPNPPSLFAAGYFTSAGGLPALNMAKWDGVAWSAIPEPPGPTFGLARHLWSLGVGTTPLTPSLFMSDDEITIAEPGTVWRWQGQGWVNSGPGLSIQNIYDMAAFDPDGPGPAPTFAYVVGRTGYHSSYVALQRLGPSGWTTVTSQLCNDPLQECWSTVYQKLTAHDPDGAGPLPPLLIMGGLISKLNGVPVRNLAAYDGASWSDFGGGASGRVNALASVADTPSSARALYVGGEFSQAGSIPAFNIARWNGAQWSSPAQGTDGPVNSIIPNAAGIGPAIPGVCVGGAFTTADGVPSRGLAALTPASWSPLGLGVNNQILALAAWTDPVRGPGLYAGGKFTIAGGQSAVGLASFNGNSWSDLVHGSNGPVAALAPFDGELIAAGQFTSMGSITAAFIASWDGNSWSPLGSGTNNWIHTLATYTEPSGLHLFAGGRFTAAGGVPAVGIARWDGSTWSPVGGGTNNHVDALAVFDDGLGPALYAAGKFTSPGGVLPSHIARWNGASWSPLLGGGLNGNVSALVVHDDGTGPALYAGGSFTQAGSVYASNIAAYRNGSWSSLGSGTNGPVCALASLTPGGGASPILFAGGDFSMAGGVPSPHIARRSSGVWLTTDGANSTVSALVPFTMQNQPAMVLGGAFTTVGQLPSPRIASWTVCTCYPNCDGSIFPPLLSVNDFVCFLNRYAAGDPYANCDGSFSPPILNVADFICFMNKYAAGCP